MKDLIHEGPIWRRTLTACGAMIGACAVFVALVLVLLGTVLDRAASSNTSDKNDGRASMQDSSNLPTNGSAKKKAPVSNDNKTSARTSSRPSTRA